MQRHFDITQYKIAFFDLDGTVLNTKGEVTPATKEAVDFLRSQGLMISLASGRSSFGAKKVVDYLGIEDPCVFFSGAFINNPKTKEIIFEVHLDPKEALEVAAQARKRGLYLEMYTADNFFVEELHPLAEIHASYMGQPAIIVDFEKLVPHEKILKAVAVSETREKDHLLNELIPLFPNMNFHLAPGSVHPHITFGNITPTPATRENAFNMVMEVLGLRPDQAIAFGDGESDIPFIRMSGLGIALANARDIVKKEADFVTSSVDDDGVAHAVNTLFRNPRRN